MCIRDSLLLITGCTSTAKSASAIYDCLVLFKSCLWPIRTCSPTFGVLEMPLNTGIKLHSHRTRRTSRAIKDPMGHLSIRGHICIWREKWLCEMGYFFRVNIYPLPAKSKQNSNQVTHVVIVSYFLAYIYHHTVHCIQQAGAVLAPAVWGNRVSEKGPVTGKIWSVICTNAQFLA